MIAALLLVPGWRADDGARHWHGQSGPEALKLASGWSRARSGRGRRSSGIVRPRLTPGVKEMVVLVLPATLGGGIYYISQAFYAYFATSLPQGSLVYLGFADRLNQLPLAIIGSALGTAILPAISRAIGNNDPAAAASVQSQAVELSMLLTLPAAIALSVASGPIVAALFQGGRFTAEDAATTALVLSIIAAGLPAYVLIKVLTPGFYARRDVKTPVAIAVAMLVVGVILNYLLIPTMGIAALAFTTALTAWLNALVLYGLSPPVALQAASLAVEPALAPGDRGAVMGAAIWFVGDQLSGFFAGSTGRRLIAVAAIVGTGGIVYFALGLGDRRDQPRGRADPAQEEEGASLMRVVSESSRPATCTSATILARSSAGRRCRMRPECLFFLADLPRHHRPCRSGRASRQCPRNGRGPHRLRDRPGAIRAVQPCRGAGPCRARLDPELHGADRMAQPDDAVQGEIRQEPRGRELGLYAYPVLQAADVLLYQATHVPVGEDQKQHVELMRDIAEKFNTDYGHELFTRPAPLIGKTAARIMSLRDGNAKMSKSDPSDMSRVNLVDDADAIAGKVRKAKTDPEPLPETMEGLEGRPEARNLVAIYAALRDAQPADVLAEHGGKGFGQFKPLLADVLVETLRPIKARLDELRGDPAELDRILAAGAERAAGEARPTLDGAYRAVGLRG
jgi:tryptophanyl-tRNA synthetase